MLYYLEIHSGLSGLKLTSQEHEPAVFAERLGQPGKMSRIFVIKEVDWHWLARYCPEVEDRGRKNKAKGLKEYLAGRGNKVPLVRYDYEGGSGRCLRGLKALFKALEPAGGAQTCILAVAEATLGELQDMAQSTPEQITHKNASLSHLKHDDYELLLREIGFVSYDHPTRKKLIGNSRRMELARSMIALAARGNHPVLILGQSGTGKEVAARLVHDCADRPGKFVAVNCAAIPADLLESELYGTTSGAFSGAVNRPGLWEVANDGTIFLDEIGELSLPHQAKLLRVLQEGVIRRIGGREDISVTARILAATHKNLVQAIDLHEFRHDLYARLNKILIRLPALADCPEDFEHLAQHFWKEIRGEHAPDLTADVLTTLKGMSWPGNVRELRAFLERMSQFFNDTPTVQKLRLLSAHEKNEMHTSAEPVKITKPPSATPNPESPFTPFPLHGCIGFNEFDGQVFQPENENIVRFTKRRVATYSGLVKPVYLQVRPDSMIMITVSGTFSAQGNKFMKFYVGVDGHDIPMICKDPSRKSKEDAAYIVPAHGNFEFRFPDAAIQRGNVDKIGLVFPPGVSLGDLKLEFFTNFC